MQKMLGSSYAIILVGCLLFITTNVRAQWNPVLEDSLYFEVLDLHFFNKDTGLVCGSISHGVGYVLRTYDGGETWTNTQSQMYSCAAIDFVNDSVGFAGGQDGIVYRTIDKGVTWDFLSQISIFIDINELYFTSKNVGFVITYWGSVFKTIDGGISWSAIIRMNDYNYFDDRKSNAIYFVTDSIGFAVGNGVYKTIDQGDNWLRQNADTTKYYRSVFMLNEMEGFVVGNNGILLHTLDGGENWTERYISNQDLRHIVFFDENIGYAVGGGFDYYNDTIGVVIRTTDRGITWTSQAISRQRLNSIQFVDSTAYVVGNFGTIFKNESLRVLVHDNIVSLEEGFQIQPNPASNYIEINVPVNMGKPYDVAIVDFYGNTMHYEKGKNDNFIQLPNIAPGIYILSVMFLDKRISKKIVISN